MIFNETDLKKYTEDDRDLSSQLLAMASEDIPDFLKSARQAGAQDAPAMAAEYLHKIKGIAGSIGADDINRMSAEMEVSLKERGMPEDFNEKVSRLESLVNKFFTYDSVLNYLK